MLFAGRYQESAQKIESLRARLADARVREAAAAAAVSAAEADFSRVRISLVEAEAKATSAREAVHACELDINRRQQQIEFNRQQIEALGARADEVRAELAALEARREPGRLLLVERRRQPRRPSRISSTRRPSWSASKRNTATRIVASKGSKPTWRRRGRKSSRR